MLLSLRGTEEQVKKTRVLGGSMGMLLWLCPSGFAMVLKQAVLIWI
jgi:hypothetical protein